MSKIRAMAFDAYGTLLDVGSVGSGLGHLDADTRRRFVLIWRSKQLEYTWLRTLMKKYADFEKVSGDALRYAIRVTGLNENRFDSLLDDMKRLRCFPDVPAALTKLKQKSIRMVILSNGTPAMLNSALEANGLQSNFEAVLSVEEVGAYKPDPLVYGLATKHFSLEPKDILFVSSNSWDASGAASFGLRTVWCNRTQTIFDELGYKPDMEVKELGELAEKVDAF
jgi:2-haloacid dehalogenase